MLETVPDIAAVKDDPTQRSEGQSETGAHASAEARKEPERIKNDSDVEDNVSGNRFHRRSDKNTVSDRHEDDTANLGLSGVSVRRNYSRQTVIKMLTDMKDAPRGKSVKPRDDERVDRRERSSVRSDFGASEQDRGRTGSKGTVPRDSMERHEPHHLHCPPQCSSSGDHRRVKATHNYIRNQEQNNERRPQLNHTHMFIHSEEGVETESVKNLLDKQALEENPLTKLHHKHGSRRQNKRPEQEVSRDASWSHKQSDQRERADQWQKQNLRYNSAKQVKSLDHSQQNRRQHSHGRSRGDSFTRSSRGNRSDNVENSPEVLAEGVNNLTLSNQWKKEQNTGGGKKREYDSETGHKGNKDEVMHKQGKLAEDKRHIQIEEEEFETNQPKKWKEKWWWRCALLFYKSKNKRRK